MMGKYYILVLFDDGDEIIITPEQFSDLSETTQTLFYEYRRLNSISVTSGSNPHLYKILNNMKTNHPKEYIDNLMLKSIIVIRVVL